VTANAKLNLGLRVGPPRPDGFHDLVTVFQSVSLADTLVAERSAGAFMLRVRHEEAAIRGAQPRSARSDVPSGRGNLVIRAAQLAKERFALPGGARFTLVKRIPAGAGMGGGSADAAAAIVAMLALHGMRPLRAELLALAADLGSDVPFALTGGTALGMGRGERLRPLRLAAPLRALVAVPDWRVSTAEAFRRLDAAKYDLTGWKRTLRFAASLGRKQVTAFRAMRLGNDFEKVLLHRRRDFEELLAGLGTAGLLEPHLTGSGSAVFGVVPAGVQVREIAGRFPGPEPLYQVRSMGKGLRIVELG
jgi:4-diphosphocytidyl-2-C-methyl-D-erythritol kinase